MNDRDEEEIIYGTPLPDWKERLIWVFISVSAIAEISAFLWWLCR